MADMDAMHDSCTRQTLSTESAVGAELLQAAGRPGNTGLQERGH
jgi:hypothetical protein